MMYDKSGVIVVILKSSFLPKKQERRILRAIVGMIGLVVCIYIYVGSRTQSKDI